MLETLWQLFDGLWADIKTMMSPILKWGFWLSGFGLLLVGVPYISSALDTLHGYLVTATAWTQSSGFDTYYAKVNAIVPLTETLVMLAALLGIQALAAGLRIIKAFLPTIS